MTIVRPPRDNLFRANFPCADESRASAIELRSADDGAGGPVMVGHFAVFNRWTEIDSLFEGQFMERFAPGAFKKTIREQRDAMRVLFQHGFDYMVGDKPLGSIRELREDAEGAYYEVPLLDARYVREDVLPGLQQDLYGASFRFRVMREEFVEEPGVSDDNPQGLPERTVKEAEVREFGPVTFPAYAGATAGVRSLSDEFLLERFARSPDRLRELIESVPSVARGAEDPASSSDGDEPDEPETPPAGDGGEPPKEPGDAPPNDGAGTESHSDHGSRTPAGRALALPKPRPSGGGVLPKRSEEEGPSCRRLRLP